MFVSRILRTGNWVMKNDSKDQTYWDEVLVLRVIFPSHENNIMSAGLIPLPSNNFES